MSNHERAGGPIEQARAALVGKRVLVVEDNALLCYGLEQTLTDAGCEIVGPYCRLGTAMKQVPSEHIDLALLDVNLHGELVCPLADHLRQRRVPFLLASAYACADLPESLASELPLRKPFSDNELLARLAALLLDR